MAAAVQQEVGRLHVAVDEPKRVGPADRGDNVHRVAHDPVLLQQAGAAGTAPGVGTARRGGRLQQVVQVAGREVLEHNVHRAGALERGEQLRHGHRRAAVSCVVLLREDGALE